MDGDVKVTLNATPSAQAVAKAITEFTVPDKQGRQIKLKKPGVLAQYRMIEIVGDSAKNEVYMNMVLPIIFVCAIGDEPVFQPSSKLELEALITRLDEDGIEAVMNGVREHFGPTTPEADQKAVKK